MRRKVGLRVCRHSKRCDNSIVMLTNKSEQFVGFNFRKTVNTKHLLEYKWLHFQYRVCRQSNITGHLPLELTKNIQKNKQDRQCHIT